MENNDIKQYIKKLKELEETITDDESSADDGEFVKQLDNLLNSLSKDIQESYTNSENKIPVKIKKLVPDAVIPTYAKDGDAGMDLTATSKSFDDDGNVVYGTGLSFEIPKGYVGLLFPRSSNAKKQLTLTNSVGVIDSGYRGEIMLKYKPLPTFNIKNYSEKKMAYDVGERIGQIMIVPYPQIEFIEVDELSNSERGDGGYGHTGN